MKLAGADLNSLRIFFAVVKANGIANAQGPLNKDASTISRALSQLESRLGVRLCERGRQGFRLTPEGETVHQQALRLFTSLRGFEQTVEGLRGVSSGQLRLGIIDNIITDPNCPLVPALRAFQSPPREEVRLGLEVLAPEEMERQLLEKRLDLAISVFESRHDQLHYQPLYQETDNLYAAADHPIVGVPANRRRDVLAKSRLVSRRFLHDQEMALLNLGERERITFTANLEAIAVLILSGGHLGFLPDHYAAPWVARGELVALDTERLRHASDLQVAMHPDSAGRPVIQAFVEALLAAVRT